MYQGTVISVSERAPFFKENAVARADGLSPELLFRRHYRPLVAALAVACGSQEIAADAVQEAFVELCKRWGKIRGYEKPEAWLMRVAVNRVRSEQRSLRRRTKAISRLDPPSQVDPFAIPEDVLRAFRGLPDRQRLACALFYILDMPLEGVAAAMGISVGAAGSHLHRARNSMRSLLEEEGSS